MNGGVLEFDMSDSKTAWSVKEFSKTSIDAKDFVAVPIIEIEDRTFLDTTDVSIKLIANEPTEVFPMNAKFCIRSTEANRMSNIENRFRLIKPRSSKPSPSVPKAKKFSGRSKI